TWWATVLDISRETIRPKDHFVRLGGDSISAMRLAALARREKMLLTVQHILMAPRLAHMAEAMTALQPEKESDVAPFSLLRNRSS
ncbi:UNVERIFIED_CONTAM: phosphopantetheine-binding protein, partial [Bacteroidetes bacterium 56_B9]